MTILHTSDWHIGQRLYGEEREEEHRLFFDWLIETINTQNVDVLLVAGDVFDVAYPSNSALQLYYQTLTRIKQTNCRYIVITGGNHDSVSTLNAPKEVLQYLDVHVVGGVGNTIEDEIIEIQLSETDKAVICAVPFLRDRDIRQAVAGESYENRTKAIREGIAAHYQQLAEATERYKKAGIPLIATGHLFVNGATTSESERDIYIGNLGEINVKHFPPVFDYLALGHIHKPQIVANNPAIRYSGAPIPLSFSERHGSKSVVLIRTMPENDEKLQPPELIQVPAFRELIAFKGNFREVMEKIHHFSTDASLQAWAEVEITEEKKNPAQIEEFEQLRQVQLPVKILKYQFRYTDEATGTDELYNATTSLRDLEVGDVFKKLLENQGISDRDDLIHSFNELVEKAHES